ncbi:uncharacterized protein KY384_001242 [Bacidia gigantensis]|uniref:uncharacterized protein n=1 Tax=Bacidia gigantensis TaxID=2732470 RepID=UPI001D03B03A|nr:uncharacterized protein KY384_001242 [Bacidia gigantensis]KAG8534397.1 hypothetical protein KY384_001242 [Bacidia gigantensis]
MALFDLPNELLVRISDELWLPDLENFAFASRRLYRTCQKKYTRHKALKKQYQCLEVGRYHTPGFSPKEKTDLSEGFYYTEHMSIKETLPGLWDFHSISVRINEEQSPLAPSCSQTMDINQLEAEFSDRVHSFGGNAWENKNMALWAAYLMKATRIHTLSLELGIPTSFWMRTFFQIMLRSTMQHKQQIFLTNLNCIHIHGYECDADLMFILTLPSLRRLHLHDVLEESTLRWPDNTAKSRVSLITMRGRHAVAANDLRVLSCRIKGPCIVRVCTEIYEEEEGEDHSEGCCCEDEEGEDGLQEQEQEEGQEQEQEQEEEQEQEQEQEEEQEQEQGQEEEQEQEQEQEERQGQELPNVCYIPAESEEERILVFWREDPDQRIWDEDDLAEHDNDQRGMEEVTGFLNTMKR